MAEDIDIADSQDSSSDEEEVDFISRKKIGRVINAVKRPIEEFLGIAPPAPVWEKSDVYTFSHGRRGTFLLFNNEHFKSHRERPGTHVDAEKLEVTFTNLGFNVLRYDNQTRKQMMKTLKKLSRADHSNADCFACAVLSHGDSIHIVDKHAPGRHELEDLVYATDQIVLTKEIIRLFSDSKCPSLKGKPRLFFMQACRGRDLDDGVDITVYDNETDARRQQNYEVRPSPLYKDCLVMYATPPGYYAFRRPDTGSWFIKALCQVLSQPGVHSVSLTKLLTAVINLVAIDYQSKTKDPTINAKKQTPCFCSMLTKDVYFTSMQTQDGSKSG